LRRLENHFILQAGNWILVAPEYLMKEIKKVHQFLVLVLTVFVK
jgi:hypothetical protein